MAGRSGPDGSGRSGWAADARRRPAGTLPDAAATNASAAERTAPQGGDASGADGKQREDGAAGPGAPTVVERAVYRNAPGDAVELAIVYEIPDAVSRLAFWIERPDVSVLAADGFERSGVGRYTWQGSVDGPAFEWDGEGNRATVVLRQSLDDDGPATYGAGAEDWALLLRPRTHTRWRYRGPEPVIDREAAVRGVGVAGKQFAVLGEHEIVARSVEAGARTDRPSDRRSGRPAERNPSADVGPVQETVRLVIPEAADLVADRSEVLDALTAASERLDIGGRSPVVTVFVAPTEGVTWAHRGLSLGPDARVNDVAPLSAPTNIWVHEYVHTRQDRAATAPGTQWLLEATAEYYAVTQAFERGAVEYETYRQVLERGSEGQPGGAILADPETWAEDAQYRKGALVVAALDRRIRAATGGEATVQAVLRAWNGADPGTFDAAAFADAVEAAGGPAARAAAIAYTQTPTTPTCWSAAAHAAIFDLDPAACGVEIGPVDGAVAGREGGDAIAASGVDPSLHGSETSEERPIERIVDLAVDAPSARHG